MSEERVVFLRSDRVILRPLGKSDLPRLMKWINDPEVRYFLEAFMPMHEGEEEEWLERLSKRKPNDLVLAIETTATAEQATEGVHIGNMGLHRINWRDRTATTGAMIGESEYWGKGLGTEAKMLLLDYAFNTLNLRKITSQVIAFNERSVAYSKKCGYREEGVLRQHMFRAGQYWDLIQLAVFREDFQPIWEEWQKKRNQ
ncbi:MAG: GNAT family protein [bacterium]